MRTENLEKALTQLDSGDLAGARALAGPLLLDDNSKAEGLFVLGRVYQLEDKHHVALYLLEQASARVCPPDTGEYLAASQAKVEAAGWTEDFTDRGHTVCNRCRLYHRSEFTQCPYCEGAGDPEPADGNYEKFIGNEELGWEDDLLDKAEKVGRNVVSKARELADSKSVHEIGERARALGTDAAERARALSEKEEVKEAARRVREIGKDAGESVRKILDTETAKNVQETARETGTSLSAHVRGFLAEERTRYEQAGADGKRAIVIKWVVLGVVALIGLRMVAWLL